MPGSPPPMRGKVFQKCPIKIAAGITPAYAGKSPSHLDFPFAQRDHPRLCGEKGAFSPFGSSDKGSPPPMRGKAVSEISLASTYTDHPRLCGEKVLMSQSYKDRTGSPPPMRGKAHACTSKKHRRRITPAYAGKSRNGVFVRIAL